MQKQLFVICLALLLCVSKTSFSQYYLSNKNLTHFLKGPWVQLTHHVGEGQKVSFDIQKNIVTITRANGSIEQVDFFVTGDSLVISNSPPNKCEVRVINKNSVYFSFEADSIGIINVRYIRQKKLKD